MTLRNEDEILNLQELLNDYRSILEKLLRQQALFGRVFLPTHISKQIDDSREEIAKIKQALRDRGLQVPDYYIDKDHSPNQNIPNLYIREIETINSSSRIDITTSLSKYPVPIKRIDYKSKINTESSIIKIRLAKDSMELKGEKQASQTSYIKSEDLILPEDIGLIDILDEKKHILIVGAPGAGKTFMLYELSYSLLMKLELNPSGKIPIVLSLANWKSEQSIYKWIVDEFSEIYEIDSKITKSLMESGRVVILLDDLDKIYTFSEHKQCVSAIQLFLNHKNTLKLSVVVACRDYEYQKLSTFRFDVNLALLPLMVRQINQYLHEPRFSRLRQAINTHPELANFANTPFFLKTIYQTYNDHIFDLDFKDLQTIFLSRIIRDYASSRSNADKESRIPITHLQTFLIWLARGMNAHNKQDFHIEFLQHTWLPLNRWFWYSLSLIVTALLSGLVILLLGVVVKPQDNRLVDGVIYGLIYGFTGPVVTGLAVGMVFRLVFEVEKIDTPEVWRWSWDKFTSKLKNYIVSGLILGLMIGLITGVVIGLVTGTLYGLVAGLVAGLVYGLVTGSLQGLKGGFVTSLLNERQIPNQAIRRSFRSAIIGGIVGGLVGGIISIPFGGLGSASPREVVLGLILGAICGIMHFGGSVVIQHYTLRFLLFFSTPAPFLLVPWLEEACKRDLLVRIGGGYRFRHKLLQNYFMSLENPDTRKISFLVERENRL